MPIQIIYADPGFDTTVQYASGGQTAKYIAVLLLRSLSVIEDFAGGLFSRKRGLVSPGTDTIPQFARKLEKRSQSWFGVERVKFIVLSEASGSNTHATHAALGVCETERKSSFLNDWMIDLYEPKYDCG